MQFPSEDGGRKMKKMISISLCCFFSIAILSACAPSRLEMDYGTSFKLQKFNQTADLEAGKKAEPAEGMDGKAAQAAAENYQKGFKKEPPPPTFTLSVGK
jgi:hypothetical protein